MLGPEPRVLPLNYSPSVRFGNAPTFRNTTLSHSITTRSSARVSARARNALTANHTRQIAGPKGARSPCRKGARCSQDAERRPVLALGVHRPAPTGPCSLLALRSRRTDFRWPAPPWDHASCRRCPWQSNIVRNCNRKLQIFGKEPGSLFALFQNVERVERRQGVTVQRTPCAPRHAGNAPMRSGCRSFVARSPGTACPPDPHERRIPADPAWGCAPNGSLGPDRDPVRKRDPVGRRKTRELVPSSHLADQFGCAKSHLPKLDP